MKKQKKREDMSPSCPISMRYVDSNIIRLISLQVALFSIALIFSASIIFAYVLLIDYVARVSRLSFLSPFTLFAQSIVTLFSIEEKKSNEAPKRFALYLGFSIAIIITLAFIFNFYAVVFIATIILFTCSIIETLFDFCIGCKIYYMLQLGINMYKKGDL